MTQEVTMPGPVPARDEQRRRRNAPARPTTRAEMIGKVKVPPTPAKAHPIAKRWYQSLKESGQAKWFEPSDWAAAIFLVHEMTRHLANHRPSPEWLKAIWSAMNDLLTTEAARRRVRMEIERDKPADDDEYGEDASVVSLDRYRNL